MKGRDEFSHEEVAQIKELLRKVRGAPRERQKRLRDELRDVHGFYITDFAAGPSGFTAEDFEDLLRAGRIRVRA